MKLSFGMIFSIILIIVFLVVAFYAIQKFIVLQKDITYKQFISDFQDDVDKMWKGSPGSQIQEYLLPASITSICFVDAQPYNMKANYKNKYFEETINHLNIVNTTKGQNQICIEPNDSKLRLILQKKNSDPLVTIIENVK